MAVKRYELSDAQWQRIASLLPGKVADPGRSGTDNRLFVNGWQAATGKGGRATRRWGVPEAD